MNRSDGPSNAFEAGKPGTEGRNRAEASIEQLRQRGGIFVNAVRATRMPMALTDPNLPGNPIVFANDAFLKLSGYRMDEVLGQQPHFMNGRLTNPQDVARFAEALRSDQDDIIETVQYRKDGSKFVATVLLSAFKDDEGHVLNHFMSWLDVTRRVEAEDEVADLTRLHEALRDSEAKFRSMFDTMIEACCFFEMIYDNLGRPVDWKILEANPAYETQSGLKDVVGKLASEVMPGTEPYWIEAFGRVAETGEPELIEKWHQPTGRWIHSSTARVGGSGSRRLVSVFYDITERKRNETALRESEARLAAAFESVPAGLAVLDLDGLAVIANGEFRRFLPTGVIPSRDPEHMGRWRTWDDAGRLLDPQDWPSARALRGDSVVPGQEMLYTDDDGREIWTNVATAPTYDSEGRVTGVVSVISDIDARKRSEEALRDSERQAQTLLAELQHRVRNILAIVRSMIARAAVGKTDLPDFVDHLQGRISAMARTQSILTRKPGQDVDLEQILRDEMLSDATRDDKLRLKGPPVFLSPKAAEVLTLAIHELSTNSLKYGALADGGSVRVSWKIDRVEKEDWLDLIWAESGVAIDDLEPAPGFGTELITIRVPYELGGTSVMTFTPDGLTARIRFPLRPGTSLLQTGAGSISEEASK